MRNCGLDMMEILFWISLALIVYCYLAYPLLVYVLSSFAANSAAKSDFEPTVSIILSAYNEEEFIVDKIKNLLSLDYPADKIEILIGSDGSTDQTNNLVKSLVSPQISFYLFLERRGKAATINELAVKAKHEIIVFTDARQIWEKKALCELVSNFSDPQIGCVSGELCFHSIQGLGGTARGINIYWNYEKFLRSCESKIHSMLGATGAIYAIRSRLFTPVPRYVVLDDMFIPLKVIEKGFRVVFNSRARAYDSAADSPKEEHRRKVRTLFGNYQIFCLFPNLLVPFFSPIALQILSHKFLRLVAPFLLVIVFATNLILPAKGVVYEIFLVCQFVFYGLAILGYWTRNKRTGYLKILSRFSYVPYVFCLLNFSALIGCFKFIMRKQSVAWEKAREGRNASQF
jgi:biofilm PGA synthesis N-glycosyltransferase PgaC